MKQGKTKNRNKRNCREMVCGMRSEEGKSLEEIRRKWNVDEGKEDKE